MICQRCFLRSTQSLRPSHTALTSSATTTLRTTTARSIATSSPLSAKQISPNTSTTASPSPATASSTPSTAASTSAAQPFSTPLTPSPAVAGTPTQPGSTPAVVAVSSCPAGTVLKGLNFIKGRQDPLALEDGEYPSWLWTVLDTATGGAGGKGKDVEEGDLFSKSKKQRRLAAKRLRKQALLNPDMLTPKVPIYEQSVDLAASGDARKELTKAMRDKRRKGIKEDNFLRAMG